MRRYAVSALLLSVLGLLLIILFGSWFLHDPSASFDLLLPGMDGTPERSSGDGSGVVIGEFFTAGEGIPEDSDAFPWPQFRGPSSDNIAREPAALASAWPQEGPHMLWDLQLGEGHAAPVVAHGSVYILDYDEQLRADTLRRISLADGKEIWRRFYRVPLKRNHGLSRTAPAVWDRYVVTLGPMCHVMGVDALSGDLLWSLDLVEVYGTEVPLWYAGQNPLIIDGVVYLAPGGDAIMIALDAATGELLWETPNPERWPMSHASIIPAEIEKTEMLLYASTEGVLGVAFDGEVLWRYDRWTSPVTVPSAVPLADGRIFFSAGYGTGSLMLRVFRSGTGWEAEELYSFSSGGGLSTEQQSALFIEEMLVGISPKDARSLRSRLVAMSPEGEVLWSALAEERPDLGPYLYADGRLFILKDDGTLMMGVPGREGFTLTGRAKVLGGPDAWAPMALAGSRLLVRDTGRMVCLDLK